MAQVVMGVYGLTGCAGDQLCLLNCEDELLKMAGKVIFRSFAMASSREEPGEMEVALVEGSVCQPRDLDLLRDVRGRARKLVALGTCACFGGLPAMDQRLDPDLLKEAVYGGEGRQFLTHRAQPLSAFVPVDFYLPGCPVEKEQLLETVACLLKGDFPEFPAVPVCAECRMKSNVCLVIDRKEVCCGPLTRGGCGARCPSLGVPCSGCHGPLEDACYDAQREFLQAAGLTREEILEQMRLFSAPAVMAQRMEEEMG